MNLRQIELLRAVVRCETTVRAAHELGLSQPAVSNAIKQLEGQLGFPLFERINNRLFPTTEARTLYRDSDPLFLIHAALEAKVQEFKENRSGNIRLIATPPLGYSVIPAALRRFLATRPKMRVFFDIRRFETVIDSVDSGVAELGFVVGLGDHPDLDSEVFFSDRMVCVMRPEHPLASKNKIVPSDLRDVPFIAPERGTKMGTLLRQAFATANEPFDFTVEVRYCHTACVLAESAVGVAVVDPLSPVFSGRFNLAIRPFEPATQVSASVVRSRKRPLSRSAQAFLRDVRKVAGEINEKLV
ncbi:LysR family transcriptional regulator [Bradyrhizobium sp. LHD-71]|uniref:LysR family transcriptional regulator n=1 Tax=Bradyrhizobium sp. LHD-71 TaxID=3072141 RepID=UPI00280EE3C7|nr:LysR family transcriptional regulator [Bradyrhizobium sp. LHD-71]MDQ8732360.1 LysR family transcriptional regulator [Bradyrhizobium sp. LHD-71]